MYVELLVGNESGTKVYQPVVQEGIEWSTERKNTPGKLVFKVLYDNILDFSEGSPVRMKVDGDNVFFGFVFKQQRSKDKIITVTAYDQLRYLKNKDTKVYENKTASQFVKMIADDYALNLGTLDDTGYVIESTAIEFQILYIELEYLIKNSYGDTAAREFLILLAKDRGLSPEPATKAILQGEFTPTNIDVTGKRFNIGEINYVVTEQITPGTYKVQCETEGVVGNQYLGDMIPMEYIDGLQTASLTSVLIPGEDEEDTEVFRQRYFDSFNEQSFGGNHADYMAKVKSIEGVGSCKVKRVWNGDIRPADMIVSTVVKNWYESIISTVPAAVKPWLDAVYNAAKDKKLTVGGTVHVVITDSDDYGEASSTLVQYVQQTLDPEETAGEGYGLAPIGHVVSVASASPVSIEVKTTVTFEEGHNWSNTKAAIAEAVDAYFLELRKNWSETSQTIVRVSQIENRILGVDGVVDVTGTKLNGTASNMTLTEFCIPKLGGVSA